MPLALVLIRARLRCSSVTNVGAVSYGGHGVSPWAQSAFFEWVGSAAPHARCRSGAGRPVAELKELFIREAAGLLGDVPKLLRGEAL